MDESRANLMIVSNEQTIHIDLSDDERSLLRAGLLEWWGPTNPNDALAVAMGFVDVPDLSDHVRRLRAALEERQPLTPQDWRRALLATEIAFVDDVFGSGLDWPMTTGFPDADHHVAADPAAEDAAVASQRPVLRRRGRPC